jgi:predicted lipid carrier protein YhbT
MTKSADDFFESLGRSGHEPSLERTSGTIRFELRDGDHVTSWLVAVDKGDVEVTRRNRRADCTVRTDRRLFDGMTRGEVNGMAAILRGALVVEGDPELLVLFLRLFPGPPSSTGRPPVGDKAR